MSTSCRTNKVPYHTEGRARVALWRIEHGVNHTPIFPTRCYQCPHCGWWHLTSKPIDKYLTPRSEGH